MYKPIKFLIKEIIDIILSILILIVFLPAMLIICILIKIDSSGPILFSQNRVGKNLKKFKIYKFRTMKNTNSNTNNSVMHLNEANGPVFKIKNDPRLTSIGKILRKYSLDELPQILNIFLRDMNLIGPRPLPDYEVDEMDEDFACKRHKIRPGITGLWQISERENISSFKNWIKLDLEYINDWSYSLDIKIILKTILIILGGRGH
jgi:lipopolysaccharide/colanic/teichoic acid biosynthesis glycosyltransferase